MDPKERIAKSIEKLKEQMKINEDKTAKEALEEEKRKVRQNKCLEEMTLFDNIFMDVVLKDNTEVITLMLQIILGRDDIHAIEVAV